MQLRSHRSFGVFEQLNSVRDVVDNFSYAAIMTDRYLLSKAQMKSPRQVSNAKGEDYASRCDHAPSLYKLG